MFHSVPGRLAGSALAVVAVVALNLNAQAPPFPTRGWTPAEAGAAGAERTEALQALDKGIRAGDYGNVDRLFVAVGGRALVSQRYARDYEAISRGRTGPIGCGFGCADPAWMHEFNYFHPTFHPYYKGRDVHTLQSVTKSIAATIIGVALERGDLPSLERPFLQYFADRDLSKVDPRLRRATIEDVLTMRSGIEWHEQDRPLDATNTTVQLEASTDWIGFTLSQPMDAEPGTKWAYNSGGSQLLSGIIKTATGRFIDEYAAQHLFRPLGITDWHWKKTPTGHPDTEGGLYLAAEDLAKIGYLYLRRGEWEGSQILPVDWVERATKPHVRGVAGAWDYGYQWWITERQDTEIWAGRGFGGQLLIMIPAFDAVAVVNAWNIFGGKAGNIFDPLVEALLARQ